MYPASTPSSDNRPPSHVTGDLSRGRGGARIGIAEVVASGQRPRRWRPPSCCWLSTAAPAPLGTGEPARGLYLPRSARRFPPADRGRSPGHPRPPARLVCRDVPGAAGLSEAVRWASLPRAESYLWECRSSPARGQPGGEFDTRRRTCAGYRPRSATGVAALFAELTVLVNRSTDRREPRGRKAVRSRVWLVVPELNDLPGQLYNRLVCEGLNAGQNPRELRRPPSTGPSRTPGEYRRWGASLVSSATRIVSAPAPTHQTALVSCSAFWTTRSVSGIACPARAPSLRGPLSYVKACAYSPRRHSHPLRLQRRYPARVGPPIRRRARVASRAIELRQRLRSTSRRDLHPLRLQGQNPARVGPPIRRRASLLRGPFELPSRPALTQQTDPHPLRLHDRPCASGTAYPAKSCVASRATRGGRQTPAPTHQTALASSPPLGTKPCASGTAYPAKSPVASRATRSASSPAPTHRTALASSPLLRTEPARMGSPIGRRAPSLRRSLKRGPRLRLLTRRRSHPLRLLGRNSARVGPPFRPRTPSLCLSLELRRRLHLLIRRHLAYSPPPTDGTLPEWDGLSGQELRRFDGHSGRSPPAPTRRTARRSSPPLRDKTVREWDRLSGEELRRFGGPLGRRQRLRLLARRHSHPLRLLGQDSCASGTAFPARNCVASRATRAPSAPAPTHAGRRPHTSPPAGRNPARMESPIRRRAPSLRGSLELRQRLRLLARRYAHPLWLLGQNPARVGSPIRRRAPSLRGPLELRQRLRLLTGRHPHTLRF